MDGQASHGARTHKVQGKGGLSHVAVKVTVVAQDDNITLVITQESRLASGL